MSQEFARRLKALRVQRGMGQADLVGPGVSVSYLSMLENGNREPTARVLAHLASVLGVDPLELTGPLSSDELDPNDLLELADAEVALAHGDHAHAADAFARLEPRHGLPAVWGLARAQEGMGHLDDAVATLARVIAGADSAADPLLAIKARIAFSRCLHDAGDPFAALQPALDAVEVVDAHGLRGTDEHAQAAATLMGRYYDLGDLPNAERLARDLLAAVDAGGTWKARGSAYWNAAGVAEAAGDLDTAVRYAERALALFSEGDDERAAARCAIACAWFWMRHDRARDHLDEIDRMLAGAAAKLATTGTSLDLAYLDTELARAALLRDHPPDAADLAQRALDRLGPEPRSETTTTLLVLAEAQLALGDLVAAQQTCERLEFSLLALPHTRAAALTWRGLADAFRQVGQHEAAYRALEQALDAQAITASPTRSATDASASDVRAP